MGSSQSLIRRLLSGMNPKTDSDQFAVVGFTTYVSAP